MVSSGERRGYLWWASAGGWCLQRGATRSAERRAQRGAKEAALSKAAAALQSEQELEARLPVPVVLLHHAVVITKDVYCTV